uniref:RICIN domain-containing protein n=1 Tax=Cardinium endosymbiont of Bemisia tabaci TaxID=672794 RepID=UPI000442CF99|nr:hypothetical protein [Cardinium endosymbiont of Bemisia tabaci]CDG50387.1 Hypothetical protein CHV_p022 [Cardinium endosymbiont cBtQ1 of Bemisia tabaci]
MNNVYQNQIEALPISGFAPYFSDSSRSLLTEGIGSAVANFIEKTEQKLSDWFWDSIASLPKDYFSKNITQVNHFDKSLWEGIFNDRIALLKDQFISVLQEEHFDDVQKVTDGGFTTVNRLKEQMSVELSKDKLSIEEQLIGLQGIVGKYTLSPRCYESGLDALQETACDNTYYSSLVANVRSSFYLSLKKQPKFLSDCFEGDVWYALNGSSDKSLTVGVINEILAYYKPLMQGKTYAVYKDWVEKCYNSESLLPPPSLFKKEIIDSFVLTDSPTIEHKQSSLNWKGNLYNFGKFLWEHSGKLMTLGLAAQVAIFKGLGTNKPENEFIPVENLTGNAPLLPVTTSLNQIFLTHNLPSYNLPALIFRSLDLSKDKKGLKLDTESTIKSSRKKRAAPIKEPSICTVSKKELISLNNRINDVLSNATIIQGNNNCQLHNGTTPISCTELIQEIKCQVSHLINGFIQANSGKLSKKEFIKFRSQCDSFISEYNNFYNKKTQIEVQGFHELIQGYNDVIQNLKKKFDESTSKLIQNRKSLCISEIGNGKIEIAFDNYMQLQIDDYNINCLTQVIETAYRDYTRADKVEYIMEFINRLFFTSEKFYGYSKLFEEMRYDIYSPKVLLLAYNVQQVIDLPYDINYSKQVYIPYLQDLKDNIEVSVNAVIGEWAYRIRNFNNYKQIKIFAKEYLDIFDGRLPLLIEKAYNNDVENAKKILKFIQYLNHIKFSATACSALYSRMKSNGDLDNPELIMLAYDVKKYMQDIEKVSDIKYYENGLNIIKKELPSSIRKLIWNGNNCTIQSTYWREYLYASYSTHDTWRRNIFTWMNKADDSWMKDQWKIMPENDAEYFTIYNTYHNGYLYADDDAFAYDASRRRVFTLIVHSNWAKHNWTIIPKNNASSFRMYNMHQGEYLYADDDAFAYDSSSRRVFTWIPKKNVKKTYWKITC